VKAAAYCSFAASYSGTIEEDMFDWVDKRLDEFIIVFE
jgi:hypothetical protein